jgi:uncharacterized protein (TIGR03000 family)
LVAVVLAVSPALAQDGEKKVATIKVTVPAAAKIMIDGKPTMSTGEERLFETPPLTPGKSFTYIFKATWFDGSYPTVRMAEVRVEAGKETVVDLRQGAKDGSSSQIIFVPTSDRLVEKMLEMAKVTKDDAVFDLGCGDGRMVVLAAAKYGAHGVGVDIDPQRVKEAKANVEKAKVGKLVEIRLGDALKVEDLNTATVIVLYMLPEFMKQLKPIVLKECKPGTRIVSHNYTFPEWDAKDTVTMGSQGSGPTLYLYVVGEKK